MQAKFFCRTGVLAGADYEIGEHATIGRGQQNTIVLADDGVSKVHARIAFDADAAAYFLEDLDSTNGTRLDGVPVSGAQRLEDLHVVTFGRQHDFIFAVLPAAAAGQGSSAEDVVSTPAALPEKPAASLEARPARGIPRDRAELEPCVAGHAAAAPREPVRRRQGVGDPVEPATRYEPPPALDVPPLAAEPQPRKDEPGAAESPKADLDGAPMGGSALPPVEPATRYEPPPALDVPPLGVQPEPPEAEAAAASPQEAVPHEEPEDAVAEQAAEPATRYEPPPALDVPPLGGESARPPGVTIEIVIADGQPQRVTLGDGRHVAGRARDCAVPIDDMTLSRRHAAFVVRGDVVMITDLKSLNGTFIEEMSVETPTEIDVGQAVTLGNRVRVVRIAP
ncbi:MAG: FHA domain-containing protein [Acidobacteria bacterium]|nr:FHA domain-containing protein [Acidobacteriota bacterium]